MEEHRLNPRWGMGSSRTLRGVGRGVYVDLDKIEGNGEVGHPEGR